MTIMYEDDDDAMESSENSILNPFVILHHSSIRCEFCIPLGRICKIFGLSPFGRVYLQGYIQCVTVLRCSHASNVLHVFVHLCLYPYKSCTYMASASAHVFFSRMSLSPCGVLTFLGFICICSTQSWPYSDVLYSYEPEPSGALLSL